MMPIPSSLYGGAMEEYPRSCKESDTEIDLIPHTSWTICAEDWSLTGRMPYR